MQIYPAIDLYEGKVVRLRGGDFSKETFYSGKPEEIAQGFDAQGVNWIHVVDLEGAKTGHINNLTALQKIRRAVKCKIQFGGGLRDEESIRMVTEEGVQRVVVGTRALEAEFLSAILEQFAAKVAVGLDVRDGAVVTDGWVKTSAQSIGGFLKQLNDFPVETIIYTDIKKDGMLAGPNLPGLLDVLELTNARVILSGGISALPDIQECRKIEEKNFDGVIVGKALYENRFSLEEAIKEASLAGGS